MSHPLALDHPRRTDNPYSVALSLAANRASKIALLRSDNTKRCDEIADRYESMLRDDCAGFIAMHPDCPPLFPRGLWRAACIPVDQRTER